MTDRILSCRDRIAAISLRADGLVLTDLPMVNTRPTVLCGNPISLRASSYIRAPWELGNAFGRAPAELVGVEIGLLACPMGTGNAIPSSVRLLGGRISMLIGDQTGEVPHA